MLIRIRETGAVVYSDEFRRMHPDTSFPLVLTQDNLEDFSADEVFESERPSATDNQYIARDGVEIINGKWFTKYVVVDYTDEELAARLDQWRQSASCTPFQGRVALANAGLLGQVEAAIAAADEKTKVAWEYALEWRRTSPMIESLMVAMNISEAQADALFKAAQTIQA